MPTDALNVVRELGFGVEFEIRRLGIRAASLPSWYGHQRARLYACEIGADVDGFAPSDQPYLVAELQ